MKFRLKTSQKAENILKQIQNRSNLRPNILARIAINLSILEETPVPEENHDNKGLEFHRHILLGEYDDLFKALISQKINKKLKEENYFPKYVKLHLERGVKLLKAEYEYAGNFEKFLNKMIERGINQ